MCASTLPAEVLRPLIELSAAKSALAIGYNVGALAVVIGSAFALWSWWAVLIALLPIAALQHGLFILAHDAAHYRLFATHGLNDLGGRTLGIAVGVSMCSYRVIHRLHHNYLYQAQDPDIALHGGYPRGKAYLLRKLGRDLLGLTAWRNCAYFFGNPAINSATNAALRPLCLTPDPFSGKDLRRGEIRSQLSSDSISKTSTDTSPKLRRAARVDRWYVVAFHVSAPIVAFALGVGWQYVCLWLLPLVTFAQAILRLRAICEHGAVTDLSSPLTAARTNLVNGWQRFLLFPHHVNHHLEHHLYPAVPHYNLPRLHRALLAHGILENAEVRPWPQTLSRIFAERT